VAHGVNRMGKRVHYYFNYSATEAKASYAFGGGTNLLNGMAIKKSGDVTLGPWDLAIIEEQ